MQQYFGELIAIAVAVSWTFTALFFEFAGNRIGSLAVNLLRLFFAFFLLGALLYFTTGSFMPANADGKTWLWMSLSGLVGFVFGDLCLFYSYILITARFSQLLMTLAPPFAAFFGWMMLGENLSPMGFLGMAVTMTGIAISILKRGGKTQPSASQPNGSQPNASQPSESEQIKDDTLVAGVSSISVVTDPGISAKRGIHLHLPLKGVLLGLGGALGQGLGIVLSKIGMNHYAVASKGSQVADFIPFAATQMRIITGVIGFALIIFLTRRAELLRKGIKDRKAVAAIFMGAIFGPFVGVSLSLMAVQHTNTAVASTIMATTPIIILIPYVLLYKKKISFIEVLGAILSVVGVSLFFL
ncbi:MAG: EamA family transporter [Bacteroidetes bacterium HGW-Bacteroidetes-5]|jgi:drug/metabolite transporter (DMT)-like permease|nr:MAG: EamA family transporter [Bacteroidetes bacterium HGW-Bacteroidetes-5]